MVKEKGRLACWTAGRCRRRYDYHFLIDDDHLLDHFDHSEIAMIDDDDLSLSPSSPSLLCDVMGCVPPSHSSPAKQETPLPGWLRARPR